MVFLSGFCYEFDGKPDGSYPAEWVKIGPGKLSTKNSKFQFMVWSEGAVLCREWDALQSLIYRNHCYLHRT
jgi:hypothetical protein